VTHQRLVFLSIINEDIPYVDDGDRITVTPIGNGVFLISARFGYREQPNVPRVLQLCQRNGLQFDVMQTSFFVGKSSVVLKTSGGIFHWRRRLFYYMQKMGFDAAQYFSLPPNRVIELGSHIEL
jgi:KUP system potassium uptake protein